MMEDIVFEAPALIEQFDIGAEKSVDNTKAQRDWTGSQQITNIQHRDFKLREMLSQCFKNIAIAM